MIKVFYTNKIMILIAYLRTLTDFYNTQQN